MNAYGTVMMAGVENQNSKTLTSSVQGVFRTDPKTCGEFMILAHRTA